MRQDNDPAVQRIHKENAERKLLASFISGLSEEIGRMTKILNLQTVDEAIATALTIREALREEKGAETFFTRFEDLVGVSGRGGVRHVQERAEFRCYECDGRAHLARECPTRLKREQSRNSPGDKFQYAKGREGSKQVSVHMERGSTAISVEIEGRTKRLIIDTGSSVSILQPGVSRNYIAVTAIKPYGVTGENLDIQGRQCVSFVLGGKTFRHTF
jgi:predicted Fe-S protein YdhL (DUF1289 family)